MPEAAFVSANPAGSTHDRSRDYNRILRRHHLPAGGVMDVWYTDTGYNTVAQHDGHVGSPRCGPARCWQPSWRHLATGSAESAARVAEHAHTLHTWFNVSEHPGFLARYARPAGASNPVPWDCDAQKYHCDVTYEGQRFDWLGDTSRDEYTGVMLGYYLAYLATPDAAVREMLRAGIIKLAMELLVVHEGSASARRSTGSRSTSRST